MATPTQVRSPNRTTIRTIFQVTLALAALAPFIVEEAGIATVPIVAGILAVAAALTRAMALPQVNDFLTNYVPWLAADAADEDEE